MTKKVLRLQKQINRQLNRKNKAKRGIILSLIVLCAVLICLGVILIYNSSKNNTKVKQGASQDAYDFTISFVDVGEGNACLIKCKGEAMLVDTGYYEHVNKLESAISAQGIDSFKYVVASHPDADHIGSMAHIIKGYEVGKILMSDATNDTVAYNKMLEAIDEKKLPVDVPDYGATYKLGDAKITVLSSKHKYEDINDYSLVLKLEYEGKRFLIMGDASKLVEDELLEKKADIASDVILLGHHGSSTSTGEKFIKTVNPKDAVVSCEANNEYGHPHKEVLELLKRRNISVFRTDEIGNITYGIKASDEVLYRVW